MGCTSKHQAELQQLGSFLLSRQSMGCSAGSALTGQSLGLQLLSADGESSGQPRASASANTSATSANTCTPTSSSQASADLTEWYRNSPVGCHLTMTPGESQEAGLVAQQSLDQARRSAAWRVHTQSSPSVCLGGPSQPAGIGPQVDRSSACQRSR